MRVVLAGAGLAAQRCAEALRAVGHDGPITMIGAERHPPYDRPPLSKTGPRLAVALRPAQWYVDSDVELRLGTPVTALDARSRHVVLRGGERVRYDRLLIATGADPVVPPLLAGAANVQALRTLGDARRLRGALAAACRLAVVGAGLVGQEVASMAIACGVRVTLIDAAAAPFDALVGPALGGWLAGLHRAAGVDVRLGVSVTGVVGRGRVEAVELADGDRVACDHVVVGVGVRPATRWAVRDRLIAAADGRTVLPGVFAAGDAAGGAHWAIAARQGAGAARAMLGLAPRPEPPSVLWSDQHGVRLQRLGDPRGAEPAAFDGDPAQRSFTLTYERAGRPVAAVLVGRPNALATLRRGLQAAARPEGMAA
jgi:3-phenylpropionate/trans-cinnamate dioxygenase ferredoxin reductase subunit